ncbi:hypothetical protein B0T10DRAFT_485424 [Thelonectria olida]|uniref:Duf1665 domain containing protein n=1 Tax=Thelonectria olida TaxID=1576542 RepID=A0A9P8W7V8_9HYPO|nr:hypothetical protein B0T10DRAFT_485424 [Thelonectria olida]
MPDYPGLGLDLRFLTQDTPRENIIFPMGIHANCHGSKSELLLIREVAMMIVMDRLTDKPDWHLKVFDDAITAKWTEEALAIPVGQLRNEIVNDTFSWDLHPDSDEEAGDGSSRRLPAILDKRCLDYCIKELQVKAEFFKKSGLIPTLDASASMVKSDSFVDESLHDALQTAFSQLIEEQKANPDWHPRTHEKVQDLVHPSMHPLVYGRTRVFKDEVVGVEDAIDKWAGKGEAISVPGPAPDLDATRRWGRSVTFSSISVDPTFWSTEYQWLPSNVKIEKDGSAKFTSYINNLHPVKHRDIYRTIEKLIERALPAWDQCITEFHRRNGAKSGGRMEPRFCRPADPDDENGANWTPELEDVVVPKKETNKDDEASVSGSDSGDECDDDEWETEAEDSDGHTYSGTRRIVHWKMTRQAVQPEAPDFKAWKYGVEPEFRFQERFDDLQVIVKMASIELTPDKPSFPAGGWHVEGQMNEHIVGTALYYVDSENVTPSHLAFRMQTRDEQSDWHVGQDSYTWMEHVYGCSLGAGNGDACLQNYGSVETREGRLLAFPNVFHHRVSPFELKDKTKPGHRRFIALWLVDPQTRIISTANVPPQQQSWWLERAFGNLDESNAEKVPPAIAELLLSKVRNHPGLEAAVKGGRPLPAEILAMVQEEFANGNEMPMSWEEAKEHRLKLMDVRTAVQDGVAEGWEGVTYSFCEH